ncbi:MAG TPA: cysteine--tRNA ligase [Candidatus Moranbacteria bacterium]|nr:cysteine--tRNA ligase [Candidatus Moranbacteria bacterium]
MLKLYNTFSKSKQIFKSLRSHKVGIYTCGPTVYDYIHIGNIRAYFTSDTLRRYLEYLGYNVKHIKNITDVGHLTQDDLLQGDTGEDKIAKRALAEKKTPREIAEFYEKYFHKTEKEINIIPASYFPRATEHIAQMIKIISVLLKKGYAYEKNGNVFYDVTKFKNYGKLSGNTLDKLKVGARLEEHPDKIHPGDFALWLVAPKDHLMKFKSPWSIGYPGWHIECSAMSLKYLGNTLDIHTGGEDNIFPHHEAEIAQSEAYTGKTFSKYWVHTRHLLVDGEKMSKSKGNFYKIEDIWKRGFSSMDLRFFYLTSHYRSHLNFTWNSLKQAETNLQKIFRWIENLENIKKNKKTVSTSKTKHSFSLKNYQEKFEQAMNDDLNTPLALSVLFELITKTNYLISQEKLSSQEAKDILIFWKKINKVFGLIIKKTTKKIPSEILKLAEERKKAREGKDFKKSDVLREKIEKKGYLIEDLKNNQYRIEKK